MNLINVKNAYFNKKIFIYFNSPYDINFKDESVCYYIGNIGFAPYTDGDDFIICIKADSYNVMKLTKKGFLEKNEDNLKLIKDVSVEICKYPNQTYLF